jgi:tetratricopeptide (TPR) repeat protein
MTRRPSLALMLFSLLAAAAFVGSVHAQSFPIPLQPCGEASGDRAAKQVLAQRVAVAQRVMDQKSAGVWRSTAELAEQACRVGDRSALEAVFERCIRECTDAGDLYLAHLDYASALERFGDLSAAESHYRQAIATRQGPPVEALGAYNSLALLLDRARRPQEALNVLSVFSVTDIEQYSVIATLRLWFMRELGMDTSGAEARSRRTMSGLTGAQFGGAPGGPPPGRSQPVVRTTDVTIEIMSAVHVEPWIPGRARLPGQLYYFRAAMRDRAGFQTSFDLVPGQRFRMVADLGDGSCRIEHEQRSYDVDTCPWLRNGAERQSEFFREVSAEAEQAALARDLSNGSNLRGGTFAEGYSSPDAETPLRLAHRMFTTSSRDCEELETLPTHLEPSPREIVVRVGEEFLLTKLVVQAVDDSGRTIPKTPLVADIVYEVGVLDFEDDQNLYFSITGVRPGNAEVSIQVLCGEDLRVTIPIRIVP